MEKVLEFDQSAKQEEEVFAVEDPDMEVYSQNDNKPEEDESFNPAGVFKFVTPIIIDDKPVSEVRYDFSRLKPIQYINIVQAVGKKESNMLVPEVNVSVQANVFCKAADIPPSIIKTQMSVPDFTAACRLARDFLLSGKGTEEKEDMIL